MTHVHSIVILVLFYTDLMEDDVYPITDGVAQGPFAIVSLIVAFIFRNKQILLSK